MDLQDLWHPFSASLPPARNLQVSNGSGRDALVELHKLKRSFQDDLTEWREKLQECRVFSAFSYLITVMWSWDVYANSIVKLCEFPAFAYARLLMWEGWTYAWRTSTHTLTPLCKIGILFFLTGKKQRTLTLSSFRVMHLSSVLRTSQICHVFSWSIFLLVGTWVDPSTYQPCRPTFRMLELSTPSYLLSTPSSSGCWQISCKRFLPANCYLSMNSSKEPNLGIRFEENIHVQCGPLTLVAVVTPGVPDVTKFFLTTTYFLSCCWGVKWKTAILRWSCLFCHISRRTTGFQHESPLLSISPNANTSHMGSCLHGNRMLVNWLTMISDDRIMSPRALMLRQVLP